MFWIKRPALFASNTAKDITRDIQGSHADKCLNAMFSGQVILLFLAEII